MTRPLFKLSSWFSAWLLLSIILPVVALAQVQQDMPALFEDTIKARVVIAPHDTLVVISESNGDTTVVDSIEIDANYKPKVSVAILAKRCKKVEGGIPLTVNKKVAGFIDYFIVRNRNYTQTMLERKDYYFPLFERKLKEHGLPEELKYLAIVESGLNYRACSRTRAMGLWQFMGLTGKDMKLRQDIWFDERLDPERSTEAACRYLKMLYRVFGDWELVLASYNCGLGKIARTVKRTGRKRFWDVYEFLPQETRAYVPQFVAITYAMNYHKEHDIMADADSMLVVPEYDTIMVAQSLSLDRLAKVLNVPAFQLRILNPALRLQVTPPNEVYALKVPFESKAFFAENRSIILDSTKLSNQELLAYQYQYNTKRRPARVGGLQQPGAVAVNTTNKTFHKARKGESLAAIAAKYDVTTAQLKKWNGLRGTRMSSTKLLAIYKTTTVATPTPALAAARVDSQAVVKQSPTEAIAKPAIEAPATTKPEEDKPVATALTPQTTIVEEPTGPTRKVWYVVQEGDEIATIATKFNVTEKSIRLSNRVRKGISLGRKLLINTPITQEQAIASGLEPKTDVAVKSTPVEPKPRPEATAAQLPPVPVVNEAPQALEPQMNATHTVRKGQNLEGIAKLYGTSIEELKTRNNLRRSNLVVGQVIKLPPQPPVPIAVSIAAASPELKKEEAQASQEVRSPATSFQEVPNPGFHILKRGESLFTIADKYGISAAQMRKWNKIKGNYVKAGTRLLTIAPETQAEKAADLADITQTKGRKYYEVQPGDTLWAITKKSGWPYSGRPYKIEQS